MTDDLKSYPWLADPAAPAVIRAAVPLLGVAEVPGKRSNAMITGWAAEVEAYTGGAGKVAYLSDATPWCGLFAALVCCRAGWAGDVPGVYLWARSWAAFGQYVPEPGLGDVVVFARSGGGGHVGFYAVHSASWLHVLGGNQSNRVCVQRYRRSDVLAFRRPRWRVAQPASVVPHVIDESAPVEAQDE